MNQPSKSLLLFICLMYNLSYGQTNRINIGMDVGPNLSVITQKGDNQTNVNPIILISGGLTFQYNFKKLFSLKTGISYQRKGFQIPSIHYIGYGGWKGETERITSYLDYLTVPLQAQITFGKKINFFVGIGPYFGFLLRQRNEVYQSGKYDYHTIYNDTQERLDFGFSGGFGLAVPIKKRWLISLEACNYTGFRNIKEDTPPYQYTNTTDLRLGVAYKLSFREENK